MTESPNFSILPFGIENYNVIEEMKRKKERKILSVQKKGLLLQSIYDRSVAQLV